MPHGTEFASSYEAGGAVVWSVEPADLEAPVAAFIKLAHDTPNSFLLESVEGGSARGRYSVLGMKPDLIWRCRNGRAEVNREAETDGDVFTPDDRTPLESLRALIAESSMVLPPQLPPMVAGLFGYLGYDMTRHMERLPARSADQLGLPEALLIRPSLLAIFDNVKDELILAAPTWRRQDVDAEQAYENGRKLLVEARLALSRSLFEQSAAAALSPMPEPEPNISKSGFLAMVERVKEYIRAGDAIQVVCSQRFSVPFTLPPLDLYRALRRINPSPFLLFFNFGGFSVVGSSPEVLVRLRDGTVTIRPLAGTRPRGASPVEDRRLEAELLADPKERAEHLMLLDLGRNDVGRVAELGTVRVTESFAIERFSHVMHLSSNVEGTLQTGLVALDALVAGFPAGTLSGAPKVRAMEIIEELEPSRRGVYGGCIGYFGANGTMDTCIALRMAIVKDGVMHVQAGAGIVADSIPEAEYEETRHKARALFRAAEEALKIARAG